MTDIAVVANQRDLVGEGPIWVARENALYWVDIVGRRLNRLRITDGTIASWEMPEPIGWIVTRRDRFDLIVGLASGIAALTVDPFAIGERLALQVDRADHRLNDAKVDPAGRLYCGTMHNAAATATGGLYCMDGRAMPVMVDEGYIVPNGPAFSPAGDYLYHADSARQVVYRYTIADDGSLHGRRDHIRFPDGWGLPDGMTVDAQGCLWVAHWDGARVSRFDPDGTLDRAVALPASRITSCAFGGAGLDRLFVTSARLERDGEPLAGALFEVDPGTTGLAPAAFAG